MQWAFIAKNDLETIQQDAQFAALHGFTGLEFNHWATFAELTTDYVEAVGQILADQGIGCSSFGLWGWNHMAQDPEERARAHVLLDQLIEFGRILQAKTVITGGGNLEGATLAEQVAEFLQVFPPFLEKAGQAGVEIAFYALHGNSFFDSIEAYEQVWAKGLDIRIKFDPANFLHAGQDPLPVVQHHGDRIGYMHIKEHLYQEGEVISQPAAGMGDVPWGPLFAFLHEHGYSGWLSMEPHGPLWSREPLRSRMLLLSKRYLESFVL